jgi:exosortase H (IPTLxxWG-CTERM-specific)
MKRFGITFAAILLVLFAAQLTPWAQEWLVDPWTSGVAQVSTWVAKVFDPAIVVHGATLQSQSTGFSVTILSGCNGVEAMIVLLAAILAYPASWKHRLMGLGAGVLAIQLLNIVRIVSLFYIGQWSYAVFEWAHLYAWQALIMLDALIVWLLWLRILPPNPATAPAPA